MDAWDHREFQGMHHLDKVPQELGQVESLQGKMESLVLVLELQVDECEETMQLPAELAND
ncbi:hypothetical protein T4E_7103 [Trichinella pseudospiralis]|uniref:Uncharacterized protein n=1 Tax=Trichinella pseudospiralis TaxID=6337 RepID=A0A0V0YAS5_TRIPS|nr:hypothetical protein T4E_7103 [Trichinella pseudospiralis]